MSQEHVTTRVPEELYEDIERVQEQEKTDTSTTVKRLLEEGVKNWKISDAVERYQNGEVSVGKAAELAEVSLWEFTEVLEQRGVELNYSEKDLERDIELAEQDV